MKPLLLLTLSLIASAAFASMKANDEQSAGCNRMVIDQQVDPCLSRTFPFAGTGECHQLMRDNRHPNGNMAILVNAPRPGLRTLAEVRAAGSP